VSGTEASGVHSSDFRASLRGRSLFRVKCLHETHEVAKASPLGPNTERRRQNTINSLRQRGCSRQEVTDDISHINDADTYLDTAPLARPVYAEGTILPISHSIQLLLYDIQTQGIDH
jgi:hypothetical protein